MRRLAGRAMTSVLGLLLRLLIHAGDFAWRCIGAIVEALVSADAWLERRKGNRA